MNNLTKTILVLVMLAMPIFANAQSEENPNQVQSIFGNKGRRHSNGGYGGFITGYTQMGNYDAIVFGGQGGWVVDHGFVLGAAGYGFMTETKYDNVLNEDYLVAGGYGGLMFEFILNPLKPVHINFPLLIGAGGLAYTENARAQYEFAYTEDDQAFFVIEPGVELQINVVKFMRIAFGARYRYTSNTDLKYRTTDQRIFEQDFMRGFTGSVTFKFGKF